jgi:hypothetical protein
MVSTPVIKCRKEALNDIGLWQLGMLLFLAGAERVKKWKESNGCKSEMILPKDSATPKSEGRIT